MTNVDTSPSVACPQGCALLSVFKSSWFPSFLTSLNLFCGCYAIALVEERRYLAACVTVVLAMAWDVLDGFVARLTNTQSEFGAVYDSMSDIVSFGVAPALIAFSSSLRSLGFIGWIASATYVVCAAWRLARFTSGAAAPPKQKTDGEEKEAKTAVAPNVYFEGIPSPGAAGMVAGTIWVSEVFGVMPWMKLPIMFISVAVGLLMVSDIKYHKPRVLTRMLLELPRQIQAAMFVAVLPLFLWVPSIVFLAGFSIYSVSGFIIGTF